MSEPTTGGRRLHDLPSTPRRKADPLPTRAVIAAAGVATSLGLVVLLVPEPARPAPLDPAIDPTGAVEPAQGSPFEQVTGDPADGVLESAAPSPVKSAGAKATPKPTAKAKTGTKSGTKSGAKATPRPTTKATPKPAASSAPGASTAPKPTPAPTPKATPKPTPAPTPVPTAASGKP